jgi:hypothetical protein
MMNPQTQQTLMQAQMGGGDANSKTPPSISRLKAKEIFIESEEKKFVNMAKMMQDPRSQSMASE